MKGYLDLVDHVLTNGSHEPNRTAVDTIAELSYHYTYDLQEGYPLLTTKRMSESRWDSMIHELLWYFSGEEHVRNLREKTGIWDDWATEEGPLQTAYGRFWRRFPVPGDDQRLPGEAWPGTDNRWTDADDVDPSRWLNEEGTFDQIQYVLDMLAERPHSRRIIVVAWHPANAALSKLPPCHYTFSFSVQNGRLHTILDQRSADVALGVPFNIAAYALLAHVVAAQTDYEVGTFSHFLRNAHVYCGGGERGAWYADHLPELQRRLRETDREHYDEVRAFVEREAPGDNADGKDHVPNLLTQLTREPLDPPTVEVADVPIDDLAYEDIALRDYESHGPLSFGIAV